MTKSTKFNKTMTDIKSRGKPLGGAPKVQIPPLDAEPVTGPNGEPLTMEQQAAMLRDPTNPMSPHYSPQAAEMAQQGYIPQQATTPPQMDPAALRAARAGGRPQGTPQGPFGGILPPEAARDPNFVPGVGSMYAANQPAVRRGQPGAPNLSQETLDGMQALAQLQSKTAEAHEKEEKERREHQEKEAEEKEAERLGLSDDLLAQLREAMADLNSDDIRKAIEKRIEPMDLVQLIEEGECRQDVPIVPDKLVPTYRTVSGHEDLKIKEEAFKVEGINDVYLVDLLNLMQLTAGLHAINRRPLPSHLNDKKRLDKDNFERKFDIVLSYPIQMLASLSINFSWFDRRVRSLFIDVEPLKNGS